MLVIPAKAGIQVAVAKAKMDSSFRRNDENMRLIRVPLENYLQRTSLGQSPLDALSFAAKWRFLDSLVFTARGLASFEYVDLESELTPTQIYRILSLFGMQHDTVLLQNARVETELDSRILTFPPTRLVTI